MGQRSRRGFTNAAKAGRLAFRCDTGASKPITVLGVTPNKRRLKEFLVCAVLRLNRRVWKRYYALRKNAADVRERRPASLLDATVEQFMRRCVVGMAERHSGMSASMVT